MHYETHARSLSNKTTGDKLVFFCHHWNIRHGTIIHNTTSVGYSWECTYIRDMHSERAEGFRGSFSRGKVTDIKTFGSWKVFVNREGLARSSKSERAADSRGYLISPESPPRSTDTFPLNHKLKLNIAQKSLAIYMPTDNEICCWAKVENFLASSRWLSAARMPEVSPAKRLLLYKERMLVRMALELYGRDECLGRSTEFGI